MHITVSLLLLALGVILISSTPLEEKLRIKRQRPITVPPRPCINGTAGSGSGMEEQSGSGLGEQPGSGSEGESGSGLGGESGRGLALGRSKEQKEEKMNNKSNNGKKKGKTA